MRRLGVTSHQRPLAATMAASGLLDCVMVRYNAAHRGAERDVFPVTTARGLPVIAYTATRWGALLRPTPDDPPDFAPPASPGLVPVRPAAPGSLGRTVRPAYPGGTGRRPPGPVRFRPAPGRRV